MYHGINKLIKQSTMLKNHGLNTLENFKLDTEIILIQTDKSNKN